MSRTKASFSKLEPLEFEGSLSRKLRFQSLNTWNLKGVSHEMRFCQIADARNPVFCRTKRVSDDVWGKLFRRTGPRRSLCSDHGRIGPAVELPLQASFW